MSEQITEQKLKALLEISDKFNCTKLNVLIYMIFHCWLEISENVITILDDFQKHSG